MSGTPLLSLNPFIESILIALSLPPDETVRVVLVDEGLQVEHHLLPRLDPLRVLLPSAVLFLKGRLIVSD